MRQVSASTYVGRVIALLLLSASTQALRAQPLPSASGPASGPAVTSGASDPVTVMAICHSNPPATRDRTEYVTAAFEAPVNTVGELPVLEPAFVQYLKATYHATVQVVCEPIWTVADARNEQKRLAGDRALAGMKMVNTGWRYGQSPVAPGQSGFDPLALGPGGLDLSQHRLTTYFCSLIVPGGTTMAQTDPALANQVDYVSPVFQADWDSSPVDKAFDVYIRDHYVHDLSLADTSPRCSAHSPAMQTMMHQRAMISSADNGHAVPVDFAYTPAQAAGGNAAAAQAAAASSPTLAPQEYYVYCFSDATAPTIYFSEVFVGKADPMKMHAASFRNLGNSFLVFLQQKYSFKSGASCVGRTSASPQAPGSKQQLEDQFKKGNHQIVETGWKNGS